MPVGNPKYPANEPVYVLEFCKKKRPHKWFRALWIEPKHGAEGLVFAKEQRDRANAYYKNEEFRVREYRIGFVIK